MTRDLNRGEHKKKLILGSRIFYIRELRFDNGCFLAICEGESERIGGLSVALKIAQRVNSSNVIPMKYGSVFGSLMAETVAAITGGIAIFSLFLLSELDGETFQFLQKEVKKFMK